MTKKTKCSITQSALSQVTPRLVSLPQPLPQTTPATPATTVSLSTKEIEKAAQEFFPTEELYITPKLPREIAIFHVYANGSEQYCVFGNNAEIGSLNTKPQKRPDLVLGKMVQSSQSPEVEMPHIIRDLMGEFSYSNNKIRSWLNKLREQFREDLHLIIADYTDFEIPWEMLDLTARREYLGALITTARWQHVIGEENEVFLEVEQEECYGSVISYVNQQELEGIGQELDILKKFNTVTYDDTKRFLEHLQRRDAGYSLIYMACHGIFGKDIRQIALGSLKSKQQQIRMMDLRHRPLEIFKHSRSIVFINACHSGRLQFEDKYIHDSYRRGFAELFLGKGARGVIGALGGVGDKYAAKIAHDVIHETWCSPNLSIAAILRNLRAEVAAKIPEDPTDKDLLPFIYTFMYVYYGNPMTKLRLTKREE